MSNALQMHDLSKVEDHVKIPVIFDPPKDKGNFQFLAPKKVEVVGSYANDVCVRRPFVKVDVLVVMPKVWSYE